MTRTARYKRTYFLTLAVLSTLVLVVAFVTRRPVPVLAGAALVFLIPGRVQGWLWRDFFRGRRLLSAGRPGEAVVLFERFLETLRLHPGRRRAVWLAGSAYTRDIEAMTLNNLGIAHMLAGRLDEAEARFREASRLDGLYPLPHAGLADLAVRREQPDEARRQAERAMALGFTSGRLRRLLQSLAAPPQSPEGTRIGGTPT